MDFAQLAVFKAIADFGNVSKAATFLGISQPAASRNLAELEEELGITLIWRNRRQMRITREGESFLREVREILERADYARAEIKRLHHGLSGTVRLGFLAFTAGPFLPRLVCLFNQTHPNIHVMLHEMHPTQMQRAIDTGRIDVGLNRRVNDQEASGFQSVTLSSDELVLAVRNDHPLAGRVKVTFRELKGMGFVICRRDLATPLYDATITACNDSGFSPTILSEVLTPYGAVFAVMDGRSVTLTFAAMRFFAPREICFLPVSPENLALKLFLEYRTPPPSTATDLFIKYTNQQQPWIAKMLHLHPA